MKVVNQRILLLGAAGAFTLFMSEDASAHHPFEIDLAGGYRFGSSLDVGRKGEDRASISEGSLRVDGSFAFSAIAGYRAQPNGFVYLSYSRQETFVDYTADGTTQGDFTAKATVEYFQFGGNVEMTRGIIVPYLGFSLGLARLAALGGGSSRAYFSSVLDAGFKVDLHEHVHLRFLGRVPVLFATGDVYCSDGVGCTETDKMQPMAQMELMGGVGVSF